MNNNCSIDFQKIENEYLLLLESNEKKQDQKISSLRQLITKSAVVIQRFWRKMHSQLKQKSSLKIQLWWRKVRKRIYYHNQIITKFHHCYYRGVFIECIRKFVLAKLNRKSLKPMISTKISSPSRKLIPLIRSTLIFKNSLNSEIEYMMNMRLYNQLKFRKKWEKYQQSLTIFIQNYIKKKWIKQKNMYIDQKGKQRNKTQFIRNQIQKLYNTKFDQMQQQQNQLGKAIFHLKQTEKGIMGKYTSQVNKIIFRMIKQF